MKRGAWLLACVACGQTGYGGTLTTPDPAQVACLVTVTTSQAAATNVGACGDCLQSNCRSSGNAAIAACGSWLSCACPNNVFDQAGSDTTSCNSDYFDSECCGPLGDLIQCNHGACATECGDVVYLGCSVAIP